MNTPTPTRTKVTTQDGGMVSVSLPLGHLLVNDASDNMALIEFTDAERIALIEALGGHA